MAINLHHQKFDVDGKIYRSTSCGAAAAHTRGFSQKGLWNILGVESTVPVEGLGNILRTSFEKLIITHEKVDFGFDVLGFKARNI